MFLTVSCSHPSSDHQNIKYKTKHRKSPLFCCRSYWPYWVHLDYRHEKWLKQNYIFRRIFNPFFLQNHSDWITKSSKGICKTHACKIYFINHTVVFCFQVVLLFWVCLCYFNLKLYLVKVSQKVCLKAV